MKITFTLEGDAATEILQAMAYNYAMLTIKSRLPLKLLEAPWKRGKRKQEYSVWMRKIDRTRQQYKKALLPLLHELPEVPEVPMKTHPKLPDMLIYPGPAVRDAATAYAKAIELPENVAMKALGL